MHVIYITIILCLYFGSVVCVDNTCDVHATITRHVENEGFHRELHSLVEIVIRPTLWADCSLAMAETMSSGMYVNPDELSDMRRLKQVSACPQNDVDVEAPQHQSSAHLVYVYSAMHQTHNLLSAKLVLPFHLRYHSPLKDGGYARVNLGAPSLLLRCKTELKCAESSTKVLAPCGPCSLEQCYWHNIFYKTNSPSIRLQVPVGNLNHYVFVTLCTLLVTCGACVYILVALVKVWKKGY